MNETSTASWKYLNDLYGLIKTYFNKDELNDLCFHLHFDIEELRGETKSEQVRSLILKVAREGRLTELIDWAKQKRPNVIWTAVPDDFQLPEGTEADLWPDSSTQINNMFKNINAETMQVANQVVNQVVHISDPGMKQVWKRPTETGPRGAINAIVRQQEVNAIYQLLAPGQPQSTSLVIWGLPGVGKTTLTATYANRHGHLYDGGILWLKLGPNFRPEHDVQQVLVSWAGYGLSLMEMVGAMRLEFKPALVRSLLSDHGKMLIVFDDVHSSEHLTPLLEAIPNAADIILTTQNPGSLRHTDFPFQGFEVTNLSELDALGLLKQFTPSIADPLLRKLAEAFDYHAQALAIIAANLQTRVDKTETINSLLAKRDDRSLLQPIHAAFEQSYQALPEDIHKRHLRQLGILDNIDSDFSTEMAAEIFGETVDVARKSLETLRQRTLITYLGNGRWSMTALLHQFAGSLLTDSAEIEQAKNGYIEYVFIRSWMPDIWHSKQPDIAHFYAVGELLVVEAEAVFVYDHQEPEKTPPADLSKQQRMVWEQTALYLQNAFDYLLMQPEKTPAAQRWITAYITINQALADDEGIALGWLILGRWQMLNQEAEKAIKTFQRAEEMGRELHNVEIRGYALIGIGNANFTLGRTESAITTLQTAQKLTSDNPNIRLRAVLLTSLSGLFLSINSHEHAQGFLEEAIELVEKELSDPRFTAQTKRQLGILYLYQSKPQRALMQFQEAYNLFMQLEDPRAVAEMPVNLGWAYLHLGDHELAIEQFSNALQGANEQLHALLKVAALLGLATCDFSQQKFDLAKEKLEEALDVLTHHEDKNLEAQLLGLLGEVYYQLGQPDKALNCLKKALPLLRMVKDTTTSVNILNTIGLIYQQTEQINEGLDYLQQMLPFIEELHNEGAQGTVFSWLAMLMSGIGDTRKAMHYFDQAQLIIENLNNDTIRATTLALSAQFYRYMGEIEKAHVIVRRVVDLWRRLNNRTKLSEALLLLAEITFLKQRIDESQDILDEIRETAESLEDTLLQASYYNLQGTIYLYTQRTSDAQRMLERAYHINQRLKNPFLQLVILNNLAWVRLGRQDLDGAQVLFESALALAEENESAPHVALVLSNMGMLAYWWGKKITSQKYFHQAVQALEKEGFTADAANQSVVMLRTIADFLGQESEESLVTESLKMLLQAVNWDGARLIIQGRHESLLTPECDQILTQTIAEAREMNQRTLQSALSAYQRLLTSCRDSRNLSDILVKQRQTIKFVDLEQWWGYLQRVDGNYGAALAHANRVLEIDQNNIEARLNRGWVYRGIGLCHDAIGDFDFILEQDERNFQARQGKGVVYFEAGHTQQAIAQLTQAIQLEPNDAYSFQWRGAIYQSLGDLASAQQDLNQAVTLSPKESDHYYWLALLLLDIGKTSSALDELTKVIEWDRNVANKQVHNYFWRAVAHDLAGDKNMARFDWERSLGFNETYTTAWNLPLHHLAVRNDYAAAEGAYQKLLKRRYPPHIIFTQIQHLALLIRLYPRSKHYETFYHQLKVRLEEIQTNLPSHAV